MSVDICGDEHQDTEAMNTDGLLQVRRDLAVSLALSTAGSAACVMIRSAMDTVDAELAKRGTQ